MFATLKFVRSSVVSMRLAVFKALVAVTAVTTPSTAATLSTSETQSIAATITPTGFNVESQSAPSKISHHIAVGATRYREYAHLLEGKRVGLVVNHSALVGDTHLVDFLITRKVNVTHIFSPEHGFKGTAAAGEVIDDSKETHLNIPVISLYGKNKAPPASVLTDVDVLVFDMQDVGVRFYTYISTMHYAMQAASDTNTPIIILDRPNPNIRYVDGPVLKPEFKSFVGMHPIPVLHGMTVGELALMIKGENWINNAENLDLTVIPVMNYSRRQSYTLPIAPSPNLPNATAIELYPTLCFFEATTLSVGRGTPYPFQLLGHGKLALGTLQITPTSMPSALHPKWQGTLLAARDLREANIRGLQIELLIQHYTLFKQHGLTFFDRPDFMDKLAGTDQLRLSIEAGMSAKDIRSQWKGDLEDFKSVRQAYLLYPE